MVTRTAGLGGVLGCTGLTCYGGRCCETYGPCDSGSVCCEPLAQCIHGDCVIHPQ